MMKKNFVGWLNLWAAGVLALAGCAGPREAQSPSTAALDNPAAGTPPAQAAVGTEKPAPGRENPADVITVRRALELALAQHPLLASRTWAHRAARAGVDQAKLLPNPEFETELENFAGSGNVRGFDATEVTFWLGQPIVLGGKRARAIEVARTETELARYDYEAARLAVMSATTAAFAEVLAAQENVALAEAMHQLAQRIHETVSAQVEAGEVSPIEATRTRVVVAQSRVALDRARSRLQTARSRLAAAWGADTPRFTKVAGDLKQLQSVPRFEVVADWLDENPNVARWTAEVARREAQLRLEQARAYPDVTLRGGVRRLEETGDSAFVAGVSLPLPLWNRNQGNIRAAEAEWEKARADRQAARLQARQALVAAFNALQAAHTETQSLLGDIVPGAREAFEKTEQAYREGEFSLMDVLDTQRTLFAAQMQLNDALAEYHRRRAEVESLLARPLPAPRAKPDSDPPQP